MGGIALRVSWSSARQARATPLAVLPGAPMVASLHTIPRTEHLRPLYANVLNTSRDDPAVDAALRAASRYQATLRCILARPLPVASHDARHSAVPDHWLALHLGDAARLMAALTALDCAASVGFQFVDEVAPRSMQADTPLLFGRPLVLPSTVSSGHASFGVAALVLRPDRRTAHLTTEGPWHWPGEREDALRALQRVVREHVAQWLPPVEGTTP